MHCAALCKSLTRSARLRDRFVALTDSHLFVVNTRRVAIEQAASSAGVRQSRGTGALTVARRNDHDEDDDDVDDIDDATNQDNDSSYQPRMLPVFLISRVVAPESDTVVRVQMARRVNGRAQFAFVVPHREQLLLAFAALGVVVDKQSNIVSIDSLLREQLE